MDGRMLWQLVTKLLHWIIEKDLTNQDAMRDTKISANVFIKLRNG